MTTPPIRAIVGRFFFGYSHDVIEGVLRERPFAHCGIVSSGVEPQYFTGIPKEQQDWFISSEIRSCEYRGVDWGALKPLDEELIGRMRECESIFMDMVGRLEWKRQISYQTRKRWYLRHLRYWNDYIERHQINLYLSAWTPHEIPDIVIYYLCKLKGIRILFFECASTMTDTSFAEYDWEEGAIQIERRYRELEKEFTGVTDPAAVPLSDAYEKRYEELVAPVGAKPPAYYPQWQPYWNSLRRTFSTAPLTFVQYAVQYLTPSGWRRLGNLRERNRAIRERNAFYDAHAIRPDFTVPFVYLPLHFQPEQATAPLAGGFADQILIAHVLSATLPEGVLIYVKEHPWESGWLERSPDYYRDFLALPNVRLITRKADTFALREHCKAVATASGTAGGEALFRGKPVFLFGHRFYQYAPGVHRIRTVEDCAKAVQSVFTKGERPTLRECRLHLKAMEDTRVHGVLDKEQVDVSSLPLEAHTRSHTDAILSHLREWF